MTRNNKVVLGVAAGVAALAVAGMYAKKKGYLNNINTDGLKNKWNGVKDTAMKALGGNKGQDMSSGNSMSANSSSGTNSMNMGSSMPTDSSTNGASTKKKTGTTNLNTGNLGNSNPATT